MIFKTILIAGLAGLATANANAATLLDLVNAPEQVDTPYSFNITATAPTLTISFGGYQVPTVELVSRISLSTAGGSNLLDQTWTLTPALEGSYAQQVSDSTSVNALLFYGWVEGNYDIFSQTISAVAGATYTLTFLLYEDEGQPNGLRVTTDGELAAAAVPEPASWALMIGGFALAGTAIRGRKRAAITHLT